MTIEDIRKKHEGFCRTTGKGALSCLNNYDVDRLFAALDSLREEASLYQKEWEKLRAALDAERGRIYPCADCGKMRTKEEGGTTFTVCDECWDKRFDKKGNK